MITERPGTQAGRTSRTAATTVGKIDDQDGSAAAFGGLAGEHVVGLGGQRGGAVRGAAAQGGDDVVVDAAVISSLN
jgi:hypothetical protein